MSNLIPVGSRVVFTKTIIEAADGDHPEFLMAREGEGGHIVQHFAGGYFQYSVFWDGWDKSPFLCKADEVRATDRANAPSSEEQS